ncbi:MAG: restriction endonuclease subunit S [Actinomycetota bacterium]
MRLKYAAPAREERLQTKPAEALYVALENVESWSGRLLLDHPMDVVEGGVTRFRTGDVLVGKLRPYLAKVARPTFDGVCSTEFVVLRPTSRLLAEFLQYQLLTAEFIGEMSSWTFGTKMPRVSPERMLKTEVMLPSIEEQRAIVGFLDEQISRVNKVIEGNWHLLELVDEQRRRLVLDAITKGVGQHHELQNSGVAWIGEIPATWNLRRIKQVARLASGHTPSRSHPEYGLDAQVPWFQLTDIWRFRDDSEESIFETAEMISEVGLRNSAAELLPQGTEALSRTASVGFSAILGVDMATTQDFANWVPGPLVDSAYLLYALRAMRPEFERLRFGSTHKTIYMPDISQLVMPLPPLEEQKRIVHHIRAECSRLLQARERLRQTVEKLKKYRSALITAAVTGEIDVRGAA